MLPIDGDSLGQALDAGRLSGGLPVGSFGGEITAADFFTGGLYAWVWRHERELRCYASLEAAPPPPDPADRRAWFKYWNLSRSGWLSRGDVLRAIFRAFQVDALETERLAELRHRVDRIWAACTDEQRHRGIACSEFEAPGGLSDRLEEAFGMDLAQDSFRSKASHHEPARGWGSGGVRRTRSRSTGGFETGSNSITRFRATVGASRGYDVFRRPGALARRERVAAAARAALGNQSSRGRVPELTSMAGSSSSSAAGVLELLEGPPSSHTEEEETVLGAPDPLARGHEDDYADMVDADMEEGVTTPILRSSRFLGASAGRVSSHSGPNRASIDDSDGWDAMTALEELERDLAVPSSRTINVISL
jgi:hypothetical protein